jgi:hypothetical protein
VGLRSGFGRQGLACRGWGLVGGARSGMGQSLELRVGAGKLGRVELRESIPLRLALVEPRFGPRELPPYSDPILRV